MYYIKSNSKYRRFLVEGVGIFSIFVINFLRYNIMSPRLMMSSLFPFLLEDEKLRCNLFPLDVKAKMKIKTFLR